MAFVEAFGLARNRNPVFGTTNGMNMVTTGLKMNPSGFNPRQPSVMRGDVYGGYAVNVIPGEGSEPNYLELIKDGRVIPSGEEKITVLKKMGYIL